MSAAGSQLNVAVLFNSPGICGSSVGGSPQLISPTVDRYVPSPILPLPSSLPQLKYNPATPPQPDSVLAPPSSLLSLTSAILQHKCTQATPSKLPPPSTVPSTILEAKCIKATLQPKSIIAAPSRISLPSSIPPAPGKQSPPNCKAKTLVFKLRQQ